MTNPETTPIEHWHKQTMEVSWTESGKMFLRHPLKRGGRVSFPIEINPGLAKQMVDFKDA